MNREQIKQVKKITLTSWILLLGEQEREAEKCANKFSEEGEHDLMNFFNNQKATIGKLKRKAVKDRNLL